MVFTSYYQVINLQNGYAQPAPPPQITPKYVMTPVSQGTAVITTVPQSNPAAIMQPPVSTHATSKSTQSVVCMRLLKNIRSGFSHRYFQLEVWYSYQRPLASDPLQEFRTKQLLYSQKSAQISVTTETRTCRCK